MSFHGILKQGTNTTIKLGPYVASADGNTKQTGLTVAQTDILVSKNGAAFATKAATGGGTHDASGMYGAVIGTGDSASVGVLDVFSHVSPALYIKQSYTVLPSVVYDSLVGGTDLLQVDAHQSSGAAITGYLDVGISSRMAATATVSASFATATQVTDKTGYTASTVSDKTGYALTAVYDLAKTASQASAVESVLQKTDVTISSRMAATATVSASFATATQVSDKTGYSILSTNLTGVTATQVTDKAGYTASTVLDKTGYALTAVYDLAKTSAQASAVESVLQKTDVTTSSRLAATAAEVGYIDVAMSSRMAGTATVSAVEATATMVSDKTGYALTSAYDLAKTAAQASAVEILATSAVQQQISASATDVWDYSRGNWTVDPAASAMTAFRSDGVTSLWTYSLSGASNATAVPAFIKRTRD